MADFGGATQADQNYIAKTTVTIRLTSPASGVGRGSWEISPGLRARPGPQEQEEPSGEVFGLDGIAVKIWFCVESRFKPRRPDA